MQIKEENIKLDSRFPLSIDRNIVEPAISKNPNFHWHTSIEISYISDGYGCYFANGKEYEMGPNDVILFNALEPHGWTAFPPNDMCPLVLSFSPSLIYGGEANLFDYQYLNFFVEKSTNFSNKLPQEHPATKEIIDLILDMDEEYRMKQNGYQLMLKAKLLQLVANLIRYFQDDAKSLEDAHVRKGHLKRLSSALEFINGNYTKDIRLSDVAAEACMSHTYFSTFFRENIGMPYKEYLIKLRLKHVMDLVKNSHKSVTEAALDSGFNSLSNYYKAAKKY